MKKIKTIKQLKAEKQQLAQRRSELEKAIKYDWRDVKESLRPGNVAGQVFSTLTGKNEKQEADSLIAGAVSKIAARFTKKLEGNLQTKVSRWFKK